MGNFCEATQRIIPEDSHFQYNMGLIKLNEARPALLSLNMSYCLISIEQDVLL
jgi:hypothetical protein